MNETESPSLVTPPFSNIGVTVIVATTGVNPVLNAVKDGISPEPFAANRIVVLLLSQL